MELVFKGEAYRIIGIGQISPPFYGNAVTSLLFLVAAVQYDPLLFTAQL